MEVRNDTDYFDWREFATFNENSRMCKGKDNYWNDLAKVCMWRNDDYMCPNVYCDANVDTPWFNPSMTVEKCTCDSWDNIREFFPPVASNEHIRDSHYDGMNRGYTIEEEGWPECMDEPACPEYFIWNELACECFPDPEDAPPCNTRCDAGMFEDPSTMCNCVTQEELENLFPSWATMDDIFSTMLRRAEPKDEFSYVRCPYEFETHTCKGANKYWNELTCQCHFLNDLMTCGEECGEGMVYNPME